MRIFTKSLIFVLFISLFVGFADPALAYNPTMAVSPSGSGSTTISISNGQPNASVVINYTPSGSNLATNITGLTDYSGSFTTMVSSANASQIIATVAGQQVYNNNNGYNNNGYNYGGCGYYGCNNSVGGFTLSRTSLSLNIGQSASVTANLPYPVSGYGSGIYIGSNSSSGVAGASISGNTIYVNAITSGNTNISICQSSPSQCVTLYVTVSGGSSSGSVTFSPSTVNLSYGQSSTVYITAAYYGTSLYISNNSSPSVVSASLTGSTLYLQAGSIGASTITVCQSSSICGSLYVNVGGGSGYGGNINFSPSSLTLTTGQNSTVVINNSSYTYGSYYISSNSNSAVASASVSGNSLYVNALSAGSTNIIVCQSGSGSSCATLYVTISGVLGANTNLWFSPASPTMYIGQSLAVSINSSAYSTNYSHNSSAYYISSNSNSNVVSASLSGTVLNLYANQNGSSTINVCNSGLGFCGSLYVTVGGGSGYGGNLSLNQTSLNLNQGQSMIVSASNVPAMYVSSNSNPGVVSVSISGAQATFYGQTYGSSTVILCGVSSSQCANVYVTVGGGYSYGGGGLQYPGGGNVLGANTYPNGRLISEGSTVYIVYKNTKTAFSNSSAFLGLGFRFGNVLSVGNSGLAASGYIVSTSIGQHPWGSWIKSGNTVYFVHDSGLIPLPDWATFINNGGQANLIVPANTYDFRLPMFSVMTAGDSRLQ